MSYAEADSFEENTYLVVQVRRSVGLLHISVRGYKRRSSNTY
jgi:hypothetical protein